MEELIFTRRQFLGATAVTVAAMSVPSSTGHKPPSAATPVAPPARGAYAFDDEFTGPAGSAPSSANWTYDLGGGGWGNDELEIYTDSTANAYLDGAGHLVIAATYVDGTYYSARIKTEGIFSQLGGSWQASIKLNSQPGCWPAFWMLGQDITTAGWPQCGEIDVVEDFGESYVQSTVHCGAADNMEYGGVASDTDWHTYQLDWYGTTMNFFRDGSPYLTVTSSEFPAGTWPFGPGTPNDGGCFMLLNLAIGGTGPGQAPPPVQFPVRMLVDYVRVWT
jgi:beta-glucanase (GH16 family)